MAKIELFETITKCYGPAAWVEICNTYQNQLIVSEYEILGPYVSLSNFYKVFNLAKNYRNWCLPKMRLFEKMSKNYNAWVAITTHQNPYWVSEHAISEP